MKMNSNDIPVLSNLYERQDILKHVAGFFAPSHRELSESLTIIGIRETSGINQHFHEIYRRQQKNRSMRPENAIKSVTNEYLTNFRSASAITKQLGALALDISEILNPNISLSDEVNVLRPSHSAFVRYCELREVFTNPNSKRENQEEVMSRSYLSKDEENLIHIKSKLGEISVKDARKLINYSIEDQKNRQKFWGETLLELRVHRIAGPIIKSALGIGIKN